MNLILLSIFLINNESSNFLLQIKMEASVFQDANKLTFIILQRIIIVKTRMK